MLRQKSGRFPNGPNLEYLLSLAPNHNESQEASFILQICLMGRERNTIKDQICSQLACFLLLAMVTNKRTGKFWSNLSQKIDFDQNIMLDVYLKIVNDALLYYMQHQACSLV